MWSWFKKKAVAVEQNHPAGPAMHPVTGPKNYYEYFTEQRRDGSWVWLCRAYTHEKQPDGSYTRDTSEAQRPAPTEAEARIAAQAWGRKQIGG